MSNNKVVAVQVESSELTVEQLSIAENCGRVFSRSQKENIENATRYSKMLGTSPTFAQWESGRLKWIAGYLADNSQNTANAADKAWERFAKVLDDLFGMTKPSSGSASARKKKEERARKAAELLAKHQAATPDQLKKQIEQAYQALAKNPTHKAAEKTVKELKTVLTMKTSEENKAHGERLAAMRTQIKDAAKKCTNLDTLTAAFEILSGDADFVYSGPANDETAGLEE